jgi:hypothetical protein
MSGISQQPILEQLNNGILSGQNAMPLKDLTSDNADSFAQNRSLFQKSYTKSIDLSIPQITETTIQRKAPGIQHGFNIQGGATVNQKKWIGGNRDSSQITKNRRVQTTGKILSNTDNQSFKNISDNNTRIDALARVRGGGYMVPPKVTQKNVIPTNIITPAYYRIVSAGNDAISNSNSATGVLPGFYKYTPANSSGIPIKNTLNGFQRSYNVLTIDKTTGDTNTSNYDIFGNNETDASANVTSMINYLSSLDINKNVIIATYDEPSRSGGAAIPANLITAIQNIGASSNFGGSTQTPVPGFLEYRSAYILVGSPGLGTGNGLEYYKGVNNLPTGGDPSAFIDLRIAILNGEYTKIYSSVPEYI